jgi:hypothetical protein
MQPEKLRRIAGTGSSPVVGYEDAGAYFIGRLQLAQGVKLPLGYPGRWNCWIPPAKGRDRPGTGSMRQRLSGFSFRCARRRKTTTAASPTPGDVASIELVFE